MPLVERNLRRSMEVLSFGGRVGFRARLYLLSGPCSTTSDKTRPPGRLGSYWMRERAHWADSAMLISWNSESLCSSSEMRACWAVPGRALLFPSAMHAFLTNPRHFVRFIALPRNFSRNSSSLIAASHSKRGCNSDSFSRRIFVPSLGGRSFSSDIEATARLGFSPSGLRSLRTSAFAQLRGSKSEIVVTGASRLYGHTSWQMSHP